MTTSSGGRVVVLTGANGGIGYPLLEGLVEDGYRVAALDLEVDRLREAAERAPEQVRWYACDVTDPETVAESLQDVDGAWGHVDILVNNAAVASFGPFASTTDAETGREFDVNVVGAIRLIRSVLPGMRARDAGVIHNLGSGTGWLGHPGLTGYAATKGALAALTRSLRLELRGIGVSCSLMVPPTTDTRLAADLGYPSWATATADGVGRKLARKIESTRPVITPDRSTALGLALMRWVPGLWGAMTARYVDLPEPSIQED